MRRIAKLTDDYLMDFDAHILYHSDEAVAEIHGRTLSVLEYFCTYPNCFKTIDNINQHLEQGTLSSSTVRGYISDLIKTHKIFGQVIKNRRGYGYKYLGGKISVTGEEFIVSGTGLLKNFSDFIYTTDELLRNLLKAILFCPCKWGPYSYDEIPQNVNTCEGVLALLLADQEKPYQSLLEDRLEYLLDEAGPSGLQSKSLKAETVVPTAMFLSICKLYGGGKLMNSVNNIAAALWNARGQSGWGLYVKDMKQDTNIGCTYWAMMALNGYGIIPQDKFQKYVSRLFRYDRSYTYGTTIHDINPKIPRLYATAMMYCVYQLLSPESKRQIGKRYDPVQAIKYVADHFDDPHYISEREAIDGVETEKKLTVHTVSWNHMTMHYSMYAMALAIENGDLSKGQIPAILSRVEKMIRENSEWSDGRLYGSGPDFTLEKQQRGKMIFPTMHLVMGLSHLRKAVNKIIESMRETESKT